nr:MAG TPA: hypothetical protein [Caudoviricetes sp.]
MVQHLLYLLYLLYRPCPPSAQQDLYLLCLLSDPILLAILYDLEVYQI